MNEHLRRKRWVMLDSQSAVAAFGRLGRHVLKQRHEPERLANQALLIQNNSRKSLDLYSAWFARKALVPVLLRSIFSGLAVSLQSIGVRNRTAEKAKQQIRPDILFIGHLTNAEHLSSRYDMYYGDLPELCAGEGLSVQRLWINQTRKELTTDECKNAPDIPVLSRRLPMADELGMFFRLCWDAIRILRGSTIGLGIEDSSASEIRRHRWFIAATHMGHRTMSALRIASQLANFIQQTRPRVVLFTYEGQSWERVLCKLVNDKMQDVYMVGYQHSVLTPGLRNIDVRLGAGCDPDHILTAGRVTRAILLDKSHFNANEIDVLGSPKAINVENVKVQSFSGTVLGVPEGQLSEVRIISEWLLAGARANGDVKFVLRLHPLTSKTDVLKHCPELKSAPKNFEISDAPLQEDLEAASWLLYRGSSIVLNALVKHVRPIYVDSDNSHVFTNIVDPSLKWCRIFQNADQLTAQINEDRINGGVASQTEAEALAKASKYGTDYFVPFDLSPIFGVLKAQSVKQKV